MLQENQQQGAITTTLQNINTLQYFIILQNTSSDTTDRLLETCDYRSTVQSPLPAAILSSIRLRVEASIS
jgi:hypothetical protein